MPAWFVILWFASPVGPVPRYVEQPVPAYACALLGQQLLELWADMGAKGATCATQPPPGAKPLPGSIAPDRWA